MEKTVDPIFKNYKVYSFRLGKYPNKNFCMVFKKESVWKKI